MGKFLLIFLTFFISVQVRAEIPAACNRCMSECPHTNRDFKPCDDGCPNVCTKTQVAEWKDIRAKKSGDSCYKCMSKCPHQTRDIKPCDRGCPDVCDLDSMRRAFITANKKANTPKVCPDGDASDSNSAE